MSNNKRDNTKFSQEQEELLLRLLKEEGLSIEQAQVITPRKKTDRIPLSFAQQRLWFLDQWEPNSPLYTMAMAIRIAGKFLVPIFERSMQELVRRHEILRTTFDMVDEQAVQVIHPRISMLLPVIDVQAVATQERNREALRVANEIFAYPFDLSHGPLVQFSLLRMEDEQHILLIKIHHIISDGWSQGILINELATLYTAFSQGKQSPLSELPVQYADYALWQREQHQEGVTEKDLSYWKQQLEGAPTLIELPTDYPRPSVQTFKGAVASIEIPPESVVSLKRLGRQEDATLFMLLLAAFQVFLARYSGQSDSVVGTAIANRTQPEVEQLIGFFTNTLVLRVDLSGQPSFHEVVRRVRKVALEAYDHQDVPFEQIVEALQLERNLDRNPLFQVMFVLQNVPMANSGLTHLTWSPLSIENTTAKFDVSFVFTETENGLIGNLEYNRDLFAASTIERMLTHFKKLLEGLLADPGQSIMLVPLLQPTESGEQLVAWNNTHFPYPKDVCMHHLFEEKVATTPDAIALVFNEQMLTYAELNRRSNCLAHYLQRQGVGPDVLVGLYMPRSLELIIGMLSIIKAGGAYVPLDPEYPVERLAFMLQDAHVPVIVTQQSLVKSFPPYAATIVAIDTAWEVIGGERSDNPTSNVTLDNLAYVIYTSGSTGMPKGTLIAHRGLCNLALAQGQAFGITSRSCVLQFASLNFDASIAEIASTLLAGATLCLAEQASLLPGPAFTDLLRRHAITTATLPPSVLAVLPDAELPALQSLISAGEACSAEIVARWGRDRLFLNAYGPTEATVCATISQDLEPGQKPAIGRPMRNVQIYLLDAYLQVVPVGRVGEIYIGGIGLAHGYLNRPDLTCERFIPHPFSKSSGERLYKTGDRAYYRPDGMIVYVGRIDDQVKIRGYRIELGEIESVLRQHEVVRDVVVLERKDRPGDKRLVAYIVPQAMKTFSQTEIRGYLKKRLPDHMIPSILVQLDHFPLTLNGKVDRRALPAPDHRRQTDESAYIAPHTELERQLVQIWQQILGVEPIGIDNNFFALGGDSILSIQMVSRARQRGIVITPQQVFRHQTIASLVSMLADVEGLAPVEGEQMQVRGEMPLTPIQHWFFEQEQPEPHYWNQAMLLRVGQHLDAGLLEQAVAHVLQQHDALRLRFARTETGWRQWYSEGEETIPVATVDLSRVVSAFRKRVLEEVATQVHASLHLQRGPMLRVVQIKLGEGEAERLLIVLHHLVVDGVSWRILLEDLQATYTQLQQKQTVQLPAKTSSWQHWARRLKTYAQSEMAAQELYYWQQQAELPVIPLPRDETGGENTVASAGNVMVSLSQAETQTLLHAVPSVYHTQIQEVLLAALAQVLTLWTNDSRCRLHLEGHGREELFEHVDLSRTVGWFTSLYPVVLQMPVGTDPGTVLKAIKEQLRTLPHHGIGYGLLRYLSSVEQQKCLRQPSVAEVSFNYFGQFDQLMSEAELFMPTGESSGLPVSSLGRREHLLEINSSISGGQLHLIWTYSKNVHREETITALAQAYLQALRALLEHCLSEEAGGYTPSDFPLAHLAQGQLDVLVGSDRGIEAIYPLSPLQQGLLFQSLYSPGKGDYIVQVNMTMQGKLDTAAFAQAWYQVVQRHTILRTAFTWEALDVPLQIVYKQVNVAVQADDWRKYAYQEQKERLQIYLQEDRLQDFLLSRAPLMRLKLLQMDVDHYEFILTLHHILMDGWCLPIIFREVITCYKALIQGETIHWGMVKPYQNYIEWLSRQDLAMAEAFWRQNLRGFTIPTSSGIELVDKNAKLPHQRQGELILQVSQEKTQALQQFVKEQHLTLNTLVMGAWALVLARYSRQNDVVFGVTVAGRPPEISGIEEMVGLFINTLPMRMQVNPQQPLSNWLNDLQKQLSELRQYEYSPLAQIQNWSEVPRGVQLFETLFIFENYPLNSVGQAQGEDLLQITGAQLVEQTHYPLTVIASPGQQLGLKLMFDRTKFAASGMTRLLSHIEALLYTLPEAFKQPLGSISLLTPEERRQILKEWNATSKIAVSEGTLQERFEAQAWQTPDRIAMAHGEQSLTYGEMEQGAERVAQRLRALGVQPEEPVGIYFEREVALLIGMLGILKAGGAYVPLDPAYPQERLDFQLQDAGIRVVLTRQRLQERLPSVVCLCLDGHESRSEQQEQPEPRAGEGDGRQLAYVIYTSGSTGRPKGVGITHASARMLLDWAQEAFEARALQRVLASTSICFDLSIFELFVPLSQGGTVVLVEHALTVPEEAGEQGLTLLNTVPSAISELLRQGQIPESVQTINLAGEALPRQVVEQLYAFRQVQQVYNLYGPTEDTTYSTWGLQAREASPEARVTIGRPLPNTQAYVLDAYLHLVPVGMLGELYLGGAGLARGYVRRADLTAERFVPDPFSESGGERLYRTGDLVRWREDGELEYAGRVDQQVKIRGYRIELGEIESLLREQVPVREAVVLAREDIPGNKRLVAYIVPEEEREYRWREVQEALEQRLPDYMVPRVHVELDALPLTPNGKVNRQALPAPEEVDQADEQGYERAHTELEEQLVQLWQQVLGRKRVGIHENFFALGGDSILSIQLVSRARQHGLQFTPRQLFQQPTIAGLAAVMTPQAERIEVAQGLVRGEVPLTPIQRWFFAQAQPEPQHWNQAMLFAVPQSLEPRQLEAALTQLQRHHDALRLRFVQAQTGWQQSHTEEMEPVPLLTLDVSHLAEERFLPLQEKLAEELQASLHLTQGPLWRVLYLERGAGQAGRLLIVIHHLLIDGVSWRILLEDLETAYRQVTQGQPVQLPARTTSWQQWAQHLHAYAHAPALREELPFWLSSETSPISAMTCDLNEGENTAASARSVLISLSAQQTQALLQEVPPVYHTQINDVLLTALAQVLQAWSGQHRCALHLEGHGRQEQVGPVDLSRTVGWFTTLYPVQLQVPVGATTGTALKAIKEQLRAIPQQGIGYGLLRYLGEAQTQEALQAQEAGIEVSFNYLGQFDQVLGQESWLQPVAESSGQAVSARGKRQHLLEINGSISGGQLHLAWTYSANRHRAATIEHLARAYQAALEAVIAHCQQEEAGGFTPSDFPLARVTQEQLEQLEVRYPEVEALYPLSPLQQGLLFQSLYAPGEGDYITQVSTVFEGQLDLDAFAGAWQQVVQRHAILRTAFVWEGVEAPLQVVLRQVAMPIEIQDWRMYPADERLSAYLQTDRVQGFELSSAPLMRSIVIRTDEERYVCVWTHHHVLLDGWSLPLVLNEVLNSYNAIVHGKKLLPGNVPLYHNYIDWLVRQDMSDAEAFWRQTLRGFSTPTQLDIDRRVQSLSALENKQGLLSLRLSDEVTHYLQDLAQRQQVTLNTAVLGGWAILLSHYSGQSDIVFGATVSGRPAEVTGIESMVGLFINTLPVRVNVTHTLSLSQWLQQLQEMQSEMRQYEYSPLVQVQGWSDVPRGMPLFENLFVFENYPIHARENYQSLNVQSVHIVEQTSHPLTLVAMPGKQLSLKLMYDRARFDDTSMELLLNRLSIVLEEMAANPALPPALISMLALHERQRLLTKWNQLSSSHLVQNCLHQQFEAQSARTPDAIALVHEEECLTYDELNRRANQLAHYLRTLGVGPDTLVGLCVERSMTMLIGILGILKAGGAYVPLDASYPQERLTLVLQDARVAVLLTQQKVQARIAHWNGPTLCLDRDWQQVRQQSEINPITYTLPEHLAYVIYTSGSTGLPKGVQVSHANVLRLFQAMPPEMHISSQDVWTLFHSYAFDFSVWEIWGAWLYGGRLVIVPYWVSRSPEGFHTLLVEKEVTVLSQTPSAFRQLIVVDELEARERSLALRYVVFGGEALELASLSPWIVRHGDEQPQLINMYGITETTVHVTTRRLRRSEIEAGLGSVIGAALTDLQLYVLDQHYQPVPVGITGELYVGGAGVARGYLNRAELTADRFVPNPFDSSGKRLYRTGDLARYWTDGELEYRGRADEQVKIRGFRIELGEIESVLAQHQQVRTGVVLARQETNGTKRLVAYVVPGEQQTGEAFTTELRNFLLQQLPDYMVPSTFLLLDNLPLTPNGKVDRRALPAPEQGLIGNRSRQLPAGEIEQRLAEIWQQVLGVEQVGRDENFFALGGDSILSIQIVSRARQAELYLSPRQLFQSPTIAELAKVVGSSVEEEAEQGAVVGEVPLTPIQHWFFAQEQPERQHWNQALLLSCQEPLDEGMLRETVATLLRQHDALRLRFVESEQGYRQYNEGRANEEVLWVQDFSRVSQEQQAEAIERCAEKAHASLDLEQGPLLRVVYMRLAEQRGGRLLLVIHHLAVDGVSWRILLEDLESVYRQLKQGQAVQLPAKTTSYQHWARQLQTYAQTDSLRQELNYWQHQADKIAVVLPGDHERGANTISSSRSIRVVLSVEETRALLQQVPQAYHTQINDVLLTALARTLTSWTGQSAVVIHLEGHGREEIVEGVDLSRTPGWFTSIYPVKLTINEPYHPIDALKTIKELLRQVPQHGIGYGLLYYLNTAVQEAALLRDMPHAQVSFNYLGQFDQVWNKEGLFTAAPEPSGSPVSASGHRVHLLEINGSIDRGQLQLLWTYSQNIHRPETINTLAQNYLHCLQELIALCQSTETSGYTPSDFPEAEVSQQDLDKLVAKLSKKKKVK